MVSFSFSLLFRVHALSESLVFPFRCLHFFLMCSVFLFVSCEHSENISICTFWSSLGLRNSSLLFVGVFLPLCSIFPLLSVYQHLKNSTHLCLSIFSLCYFTLAFCCSLSFHPCLIIHPTNLSAVVWSAMLFHFRLYYLHLGLLKHRLPLFPVPVFLSLS